MQKHANLVDLVKRFPTNIYLQNLASIQPRTSHFGSRGELRRWGLLHAGDGVLDRGSDGLLGTWITIDYRAATNLAATRAQGVSLQRLPKRKHARVEPLRITARARTRRTTRTLPSDLLREQRRWDARHLLPGQTMSGLFPLGRPTPRLPRHGVSAEAMAVNPLFSLCGSFLSCA